MNDFSFLYKYIELFDSLHLENIDDNKFYDIEYPSVVLEYIKELNDYASNNQLKDFMRYSRYIDDNKIIFDDNFNSLDLFYILLYLYRADRFSGDGDLLKRIKYRNIQGIIERIRMQ